MSNGSAPSVLKTIDQLILLAYKKAGLVPLEFGVGGADWTQKASYGYQVLNNVVDELIAYGFTARSTDFYDLQLTEDEQYYTLPTDIINVFDNGSYISANEDDTKDTTGETPVEPISAGRWQQLSTKSARGRPTLYYIHRNTDQLQLRIWPQPDEDGTVRLQVHKWLGDNSDGNDSVDLERFWNQYIIYALAYEFADSAQMPADKLAILNAQKMQKLEICLAYSSGNEGMDVVHVHRTPWS